MAFTSYDDYTTLPFWEPGSFNTVQLIIFTIHSEAAT